MYQETDLNETKGLYPCAYETIWSVRNSNDDLVLDLTLNQRSNDYIMAGYINKIQYVALQMMFASHLGYKVGKFCHFVQNLHIYDRHLNAANEILNRDSLDIQPTIELKNDLNFYDFSIDDFLIRNTQDIIKLISNIEIAI
jgi:thymidylate synthase